MIRGNIGDASGGQLYTVPDMDHQGTKIRQQVNRTGMIPSWNGGLWIVEHLQYWIDMKTIEHIQSTIGKQP
jgi:hypothetical protein